VIFCFKTAVLLPGILVAAVAVPIFKALLVSPKGSLFMNASLFQKLYGDHFD